MEKTFINLPTSIHNILSDLLLNEHKTTWNLKAKNLHERYMTHTEKKAYLTSSDDSLAYLALRVPATYAQISSALLQIKEILPNFTPKTLLDLGCGPGVGMWAVKELFPSVEQANCLDENQDILSLGEIIQKKAYPSFSVSWKRTSLSSNKNTLPSADLVIIASVLNELTLPEINHLISELQKMTNSVIVILEPGNSRGCKIIEDITRKMHKERQILAPYVHSSFVESSNYWIHFSQRFKRPEFLRQLRQDMRESTQMASDWEETKYAYVAFGETVKREPAWGRCIGNIKKYKGYIEVPLLTENSIQIIKILKRHKIEYDFAKKLTWGELIRHKGNLIHNRDL